MQNQFGANTISQYDYTNDELAQRTSMTTSGTAFDISPEPVVESGTIDYTTNNLNQYTEISQQSAGGSQQLSDDLDGNLTNDGMFQYEGACPESCPEPVELAVEGMPRIVSFLPHRWIPLQA